MVAFADPSVKFTLQFQQINDANDNINASLSYENEVIIPDSQDTGVDGAEIISLDAFRKK